MSHTIVHEHTATVSNQPKALTWIFLTELWERFAYWSLYSLLVMYLITQLHYGDARSYLIFSVFNALLYGSPIIGGRIADRFLGAHRAVLHGACWMIIGYLCLAFSHNIHMLLVALGILVWGNGLFKPNISALLGQCYHEKDSRRERGFTIYYMGINIGAIIGVICCGWVAFHTGYAQAFLLVAAGMIMGLLTYTATLTAIKKDMIAHIPDAPKLHMIICLISLGLVLSLSSTWIIQSAKMANQWLLVLSSALMIGLLGQCFFRPRQQRNSLLLCLILTISSIAFWALYAQMGSSLMLFTKRCVNTHLFGYQLSASIISSANGIWLLLFTPLIVSLWRKLASKQCEPSTAIKFIIAMIMMAAGYALLAWSTRFVHPQHLISLTWVLASYALQTLGELCISPIGLAMITQLAPQSMKSLMMGVWFLATAMASSVSALIAKLAVIPKSTSVNIVQMATIYKHSFYVNTEICLVVVVLLILLHPFLNKLARG